MITGHFDLTLKDAKGLTDEHFQEAIRQGSLNRLLATLPTDGEYHTDNLLFDLLVPYLGYWLFGAAGIADLPGSRGGGPSPFSNILLLTTDADPTYQSEWYRSGGAPQYVGYNNMADSINTSSGAAKLFEEEASEVAEIKSDPGGREAIWYRERWLYSTTEAISTNIRSIGIMWSNEAVITGGFSSGNFAMIRQRTGRVRIKDSGGNPIIINKSSSQVLLVEYKVTFVSI